MKVLALTLVILGLCGTAQAGGANPFARKHKSASVVTTVLSANGILILTDALFAEHPDDPILFRNTFGTKPYGEPCFTLTMTDGSNLNPFYPDNVSTRICALLDIYNPNPSNNVTLTAAFDFKAEITYEPDYALSYKPLPRYVVTLLPL